MPPGETSGNSGRMCYGLHNELEREKREKGVEGVNQNLNKVISVTLVVRKQATGQQNMEHVPGSKKTCAVPESVISVPCPCIRKGQIEPQHN